MRIGYSVVLASYLLAWASYSGWADTPPLRPPAVPLVASDPYLSIWSEADHLTDDVTRHWTHHPHSLVSLIRVDGNPFRLMGNEPAEVPALPQVSEKVLPTRSIYDFENKQIHVTLTFLTPTLPHDLDVLTRPVTYLTWDVRSVDGMAHQVALYDSASSELSVNTPEQKVVWGQETVGKLTALHVGTEDQPLFDPPGDDTRIDWGYAYLAAQRDQSQAAIGANHVLQQAFIQNGTLPATSDTRMPRAVREDTPVLAFAFDLGKVSALPVSRHALIAYDEVYSIKYFGAKLRPYWRRNGATPATLLQQAEKEYAPLTERCVRFDQDLIADLTAEGGERYAQIAALGYRQCLAATGIAADANKQPLLFTKENTSNGDIATVDVIFPMDPMLIFFSPTLAKASLVPILSYAASDHWRFPNAPHDLGTYPVARGTDDGGEGMPVEESGNMLILCDAIAQEDGNPKFVAPWWPKLTEWAQYLEKYGLDPEDQLCTDDFMGHLAHNSNLSIKAILGLAAYGDLCRMRGETATADRYKTMAIGFAKHWMQVSDDGDHSRLAFDRPNTWSQKYNLVWDKILGLNIFPDSVAKREVNYYKAMQQKYGVPLDSRTHLTKTDWSLWSATLADNRADFETLVSPIYDYLNETSARQPLVDSYVTDDIHSDGMHARSVVGGLYIKMLSNPTLWKKWSQGDRTSVGNWAPLPRSPKVVEVIPTSRMTPQLWRYTTDTPPENWYRPEFDASSWKEGPGGFGTEGTPGAVVHTKWDNADIYLRRDIIVPTNLKTDQLQLLVHHDEDVEVYFNGILAAKEAGFLTGYEPMEISSLARPLLKPGAKITIAVHCHQTTGGQYVDVGLVRVEPQK
jgi:hypothetical protein